MALNIRSIFRPYLFKTLRGYTRRDLIADITAGVTVGIVALPLAMAFAIASGVRPEVGLFTAIIAGFLISALGGSCVQIGGPTGAFVAIVYSIVVTYGLGNLLICTVMAGLMLIVMGLTRMGSMIRYIPYPITTGFTSGIAVLIFSTQIKDFFGLKIEKVPAEFVARLITLAENAATVHWPTVALAVVSLAIIIAWPKQWGRVIPGSIVAMVMGTLAVILLHLPVETIGSKFGGIPSGLPAFHAPKLAWSNIQHLFQPAITIALLAAIESLLSAVVADGMIGDRHDSNQELIAQGIANVVCPFFGGIPATGAIARTATNIRNGARTPIAGMMHAVTLLIIVLVAAPLAKFVPLATLSAVLMLVAYNMGEWHELKRLTKLPRSDAAMLVVVMGLTVFVDLTVAVQLGMILAAVIFIKRVSDNTFVSRVDERTETEGLQHSIIGKDVPEEVLVYRLFGAFLFGATEKLEQAMREEKLMRPPGHEPRVLILRLRKIIAMDATGLHAMEQLLNDLRAQGMALVLSGTQAQPWKVMERSGFLDRVGRENVCPNIDAALARARQILSQHAADTKPLQATMAS